MKTCSKCKIGKPKAEFSKDASKKDGLRPECKACEREYRKANTERIAEQKREYRKANAEKIAELNRKYYKSNDEKLAAMARKYRQANPEKVAEQKRKHYKANAENIRSQKREYYKANSEKIAEYRKANPEKIAAQKREYAKANPEKCAVRWRNRRARVRNADGSHTAADIRAIFESQRGLCVNCKAKLFKSGAKKYHVDHIHPLALGGSNDRLNLQCLCPTCNMRKNAKDPIKWAAENGRLL